LYALVVRKYAAVMESYQKAQDVIRQTRQAVVGAQIFMPGKARTMAIVATGSPSMIP
jgi:hypothetical protein